MVAGKAMIIPSSQKELGIDLYTDLIINKNAVFRISEFNTANEIAEAIIFLIKNEKIKRKLENNIIKVADDYIKSWDERMIWSIN